VPPNYADVESVFIFSFRNRNMS